MARFSVALLVLLAGFLVLGVPADRPAASPRGCLVVDTDVGLDDYRAIAMLAPARELRAVVVTEGIAGVPGGATAISMFLASRGDTPPVVPGLAAADPPDYEWLPAVRAGAERMNNFLHAAVPFTDDTGTPGKLAHQVRTAVRGCATVDVLVLGPWTSFPHYAPVLGARPRVIASGRPFAENHPDNFNCEYDLPACRAAAGRTRAVFVDLPAGAGYYPTEAMVARLRQTGMPGLLRTALQVDPAEWLGTRLWDDAAALYLLAPRLFEARGQHVEPVISDDDFRTRVVDAINAR